MKKQDLKAGMMVKLRNRYNCCLIPSKKALETIFISDKGYQWFSSLDEWYDEKLNHASNDAYDIMEIYDLAGGEYSPADVEGRTLLWKREPEIKLKDREIEVLKALKVLGFKFIVRESKGLLVALNKTPKKINDCFCWIIHFDSNVMRLDQSLFSFIHWEDEEPTSIDELLEQMK
jgi:hypothetical protein